LGFLIKTKRTYTDVITGGDSMQTESRLYLGRSDYLPFGIQGQLGVINRFKNNISVSEAAMIYYSTPLTIL